MTQPTRRNVHPMRAERLIVVAPISLKADEPSHRMTARREGSSAVAGSGSSRSGRGVFRALDQSVEVQRPDRGPTDVHLRASLRQEYWRAITRTDVTFAEEPEQARVRPPRCRARVHHRCLHVESRTEGVRPVAPDQRDLCRHVCESRDRWVDLHTRSRHAVRSSRHRFPRLRAVDDAPRRHTREQAAAGAASRAPGAVVVPSRGWLVRTEVGPSPPGGARPRAGLRRGTVAAPVDRRPRWSVGRRGEVVGKKGARHEALPAATRPDGGEHGEQHLWNRTAREGKTRAQIARDRVVVRTRMRAAGAGAPPRYGQSGVTPSDRHREDRTGLLR